MEIANSSTFQLAIEGNQTNKKWQPSLEDLSPEWKMAITEQSTIGWSQIFYGRTATSLIREMDSHYLNFKLNMMQYSGERWAKRLIINIWTSIFLKLWKQRNNIINDTENHQYRTSLRDKLESRVTQCYTLADRLSATDHRLWFDRAIHEKINEDPNTLQIWLSIVERLIRINKREQRKRPKASAIMERFLGLRRNNMVTQTHDGNTHNPRAYSQELNPD